MRDTQPPPGADFPGNEPPATPATPPAVGVAGPLTYSTTNVPTTITFTTSTTFYASPT